MKKERNGKIFMIIFFIGLMVIFHIGDLYSLGILEQSKINAQSTLDIIGPIVILLALISLKNDWKNIKIKKRSLK